MSKGKGIAFLLLFFTEDGLTSLVGPGGGGMTISIPLVLPSVLWAHFSTLHFLGEVESLLIVDPILQDTLVLALTCGSFGGTRHLCWFDLHRYPMKRIYNVSFPEFNDTAKIREGPCILRALCILLFGFHYNTSKCLRKQANYKSKSSFPTRIKILLKCLAQGKRIIMPRL